MDAYSRVKVYLLEEDNKWVDKGTGQIELFTPFENDKTFMKVVAETDATTILLDVEIRPNTHYTRPDNDTLILWTEPNFDDWALSFQELKGCDSIWCAIQEECGKRNMISDMCLTLEPLLPDPNLSNLTQIQETLAQFSKFSGRDLLMQFLISSDYLSKLTEMFNKLEDLEASEELRAIFFIMKSIVLLGDKDLYTLLVQDKYFLPILGMLE
ncbi:Serine/threonine-protein phosphatase 4 regulatory subunit 3, partial [Coelomomyces lativittatus]